MPTVRAVRIVGYLLAAILMLFAVRLFFFPTSRKGCKLGADRFTITTVTYGPFTEYIPQTGEVESDSIGRHDVLVYIDELYFSRISVGQSATTAIENKDFKLEINQVHPDVVDGRFSVLLCFNDEIPCGLQESKRLRVRIQLCETSNQVRLRVGAFYKDTGGKWIFLLEDNHRAVRRDIVIGRKMGSEYFEVVDGLKPGDRVITSSYENFVDHDTLDVSDFKRLSNAEPIGFAQ